MGGEAWLETVDAPVCICFLRELSSQQMRVSESNKEVGGDKRSGRQRTRDKVGVSKAMSPQPGPAAGCRQKDAVRSDWAL